MDDKRLKPLFRKLEVKDYRTMGVQISGDNENWDDIKNYNDIGNAEALFGHIIDLVTNGERVYLRTKYVELYQTGQRGLPKTGAVYELNLSVVEPMRRLIEGEIVKPAPALQPAPAEPGTAGGAFGPKPDPPTK